MADLVLVHSPLVGPSTWQGVADHLTASGHAVVVPSLLAATRAGPPFATAHVQAVVDAVVAAGIGGPCVVVGHSGAGPLLPAIGAGLPGGMAAAVFVDAGLPRPGRSRLEDLHPSFRGRLRELVDARGMLPPWHEWWGPGALAALLPDDDVRARVVAELAPVPFALFAEPLPVVAGWPDARCAYLRLSDAYVGEEAAAVRHGWPVSSLDGSHLELVTAPARVATAVLDVLARTPASP